MRREEADGTFSRINESIRESESDESSTKVSNKSNQPNHKIGGNDTAVISIINKKFPNSKQYIKSIDSNDEYGIKVTTQKFSVTKKDDSEQMIGYITAYMKAIQDSQTVKGIGFTQKEKSGDTLYAVYYLSSQVSSAYKTSTTDFFENSTSFYVDGSKTNDNMFLDSMTLTKEGPTVQGKTYTNMLMND